MDTNEIKAKIKQVFAKNFELNEEDITDDKLLFTDLGLDSLDIVDLIVGLQREFKIDLRKHSEFMTIRTFGDVCNVMSKIVEENKQLKRLAMALLSKPVSMLFCFIFYVRYFVSTFLISLLVGIPGIMAMPFVSAPTRRKIWRNLIRFYGRVVIQMAGYPFIKIEYHDLAPDEKTAGVVVANHRSGVDAVMYGMWPNDIAQITKDWPLKIPFFGLIARWGGYYNIGSIDFENFLKSASENILKYGVSIVGFPEGTRSLNKNMGQFHGTLFRLAKETNCPIYMFLMIGTEKVVDRRFFVRPGTIKLYKLPSVKPHIFENWSSYKLKKYIRSRMEASIKQLET